MVRTIEDINVVDVEKRKIPSKHYVYVIHVTWSDSSTNIIYRRYSCFFDFQSKLMEMFPEESGTLDPEKRIIPFLPGKKFFGRSHIREVAVKRMGPIAEYCKAIVNLPKKISHFREVMEFFELEPDDINPPKGKKASTKAQKISNPKPLEVYVVTADYKKQEKGEVTLKIGMLVEIVEKTETGWWFVNVEDEQGWVPSSCLEREDGVKEDSTVRFGAGEEEQYLCTEEFKAQGEDELSMDRGAVVYVIEKNLEGWWLVRYDGKEGYVPSTFLMKTETFKIRKQTMQPKRTGGPEIVKSLMEISDLLKDDDDGARSSYDANNNTDDEFDDDYEPPPEVEEIYTINELSRILKADNRGSIETEEVYESIRSMKSRSLKRNGSSRPPPRPSTKPKFSAQTPAFVKPPLVHTESFRTKYVTVADFSDVVGDGISFKSGENVKVLEKNETGWWFIEINNKEGWAPASYIKCIGNSVDETKARVPSPIHIKKPGSVSGSREDLTEDNDKKPGSPRRLSAIDAISGMASALKAKIKGEKTSPKPPRKDFVEEQPEPTGSKSPNLPKPFVLPKPKSDNSVLISENGSVPMKPAVGKKILDRSLQPPPPPPPPPVKHVSGEPPAPPVKHISGAPPAPPLKPTFGESKSDVTFQAKGGTAGGGNVFAKPKPPAKTRLKSTEESENDAKIDVVGLAGALKAKFELKGKDVGKLEPKIETESKPALKPAHNRPELPLPHSNATPKPVVPNFPNKPTVGNKPTPPKPTVGNKPAAPSATKPSWMKSRDDATAKSDEDSHSVAKGGRTKVSDLASVIKDKFESRNKPTDSDLNKADEPNATRKESLPTPPAFALKHVGLKGPKPSRPITPPTHRKGETNRDSQNQKTSPGRALPPSLPGRMSPKRPSSSVPSRDPSLDPKKYSSRPLPAQPPGLQKDTKGEVHKPIAPNVTKAPPPSLPSKPKVPVKTSNTNAHSESKDTSSRNHSSSEEDEFRPVGVSGLANMLKAKLGTNMPGSNTNGNDVFRADTPKSNPSVPVKPKQSPIKQTSRLKQDKIESDVENNNAESINLPGDQDKLYYAIAGFTESNESEISLEIGQEVTLLEKADGWWFVSYDSQEGWVPSSYLEKVRPKSVVVSDSHSKATSNHVSPVIGSKQTVFRTCSDFEAENEGEISVNAGRAVTVVDTPEGGWWFVKVDDNEGWIPESYLEEVMV